MDRPKILLYDIETAHNLVAAFKLYEDYAPPENIQQERYVISVAWKWLGESKTYAVSVLDCPELFEKDPHNDLYVLKTFHEVLSEADVIVGHNSDKFDIRFLEGRMLIQGLSPLPPIQKMDTMKIAKKRFLFNSNKLDYLGKVLGVGRKIKTTPGLWLRVLNGDKEAVAKMVTYNKGDVDLLERVFKKLIPYIRDFNFPAKGERCPRCGSKHTQSRGVSRTISRSYQRFQCQKCGGWFRALKTLPNTASVRSIA